MPREKTKDRLAGGPLCPLRADVGAMLRFLVLGQSLMIGVLIVSWTASSNQASHPLPVTLATPPSQAQFDYAVLIIMNNASASNVYGSSAAPYLNSLANTYGYATSYSSVAALVSLPNNLALIGGNTFGINTDCAPSQCPISAPNIVDRIETAGLTWKGWAEDYPTTQGCSSSANNAGYIASHFPFVYFEDITSNSARCHNLLKANSSSSSGIETDDLFLDSLGSTSTAGNFMWLTPNQCDDGHDCSLSTADKYLSQLVPKILNSYIFSTQKAALFITFSGFPGSSTGKVPAIWAGPAVKTKFRSSNSYTHYSFLATLETAWGLSSLTSHDGSATSMTEFFKIVAPVVSLSSTPSNPVTGQTINFTATATGGTGPYSFAWTFGDGTTLRGGASNPNVATHSYSATGSYSVQAQVTDALGMIGSATSTVVVVAPLTVTVSGPSTGTVGVSVIFAATASGGTSPYSYKWNFGDTTANTSTGTTSTASHTYTSSASYKVTVNVTDAKSRVASTSTTITINPPALIVAVTGPSTTDAGTLVTLTATASGGTTPYTSFNWNFGDTTTGSGNTVTHTYTTPGTYTITVTVTDSRGTTATSPSYSLLIAARPQISSATGTPNPSEVSISIAFSASVTGGVSPVTCAWNFGDSSPIASGCSVRHTYAGAGNFTATVTGSDSIGATATGNIRVTINQKLSSSATANPLNAGLGQSISLTAVTSGGVGTVTCTWNFGDSSSGTGCSTTHAYSSSGTFTASVVATDSLGVTASSSVNLTVQPMLAVTATAGPTPTELTVPVSFTATATGGVGTPVCSWVFGDAGTANGCSTSHTYTVVGLFTANITATDTLGKTASFILTVTVNAKLSAAPASSLNPTEVGKSSTLTAGLSGGVGTPTCTWNLSDSGTGTGCSITHTYATSGTFTATVTTTDSLGVIATNSVVVVVNPKLTVTATAAPSTITVGQSVTFGVNPIGGVGTIGCNWDYGDSATGTGCSTLHTYTLVGTFTATITATDTLGIAATSQAVVTVQGILAVTLAVLPSPTELNVTTTLTATPGGGTTIYISYSWAFGDGTNATSSTSSTTHTYNSTGVFSATVSVTDSSGKTATSPNVPVTVDQRLSITIGSASPNPSEVSKLTTFTVVFVGGVGFVTCDWDFGDSSTGTGCSTSHAYTTLGTFTPVAMATDSLGVRATNSLSLNIQPRLAVSVTANPDPTEAIVPVNFTAQTTGGVGAATCIWTFGDGATATGCTSNHTYSVGTFTASVTATDTIGVTTTSTTNVTVNPKLAIVVTANPSPSEAGRMTELIGAVDGGVGIISCSWDYGDSARGTGCSTTHTYAIPGLFTANVNATDTLGVLVSARVDLAVNPRLSVVATVSPNPTEATVPVNFTVLTFGGVGNDTCSWTFGDGATANTCTPSHTYAIAGVFNATITATDSIGVATTSNASLTVNEKLAITSISASPNPTEPTVMESFTVTTSGGVGNIICRWTFGDSDNGTGCAEFHSFASVGTFTATVTLTDGLNVVAGDGVSVIVAELCVADFAWSPVAPEGGQPLMFTATTANCVSPVSFTWNFGDGGLSTNNPATRTYTNTGGSFRITLTVVDGNGVTVSSSHQLLIAPKLSVDFTYSPSTLEGGQTATFTAVSTGGVGAVNCNWNFSDGSSMVSAQTTIHIYNNAGGTFNVTVTGTDSNGVSISASHIVVVAPRLSMANFSLISQHLVVGTSLVFKANYVGGIAPYTYTWNFGDNSQADNNNPASHTYTGSATYYVTLSIKDANNFAISITRSITIAPNTPPAFKSLPASQTVVAGQTLSFEISASDQDGEPISIAADGLPEGASFDPDTDTFSWTPTNHQTGNYSITFIVRDAGLPPMATSQTLIVQVKPDPNLVYRTLGLPLDDRIVILLGFLGLISALTAAFLSAMHDKSEPDLVEPVAVPQRPNSKRRSVDWVEEETS